MKPADMRMSRIKLATPKPLIADRVTIWRGDRLVDAGDDKATLFMPLRVRGDLCESVADGKTVPATKDVTLPFTHRLSVPDSGDADNFFLNQFLLQKICVENSSCRACRQHRAVSALTCSPTATGIFESKS